MTGRLLTEIEVFRPKVCQVYPHADGEWAVESVRRQRLGGEKRRTVEEFTLDGADEAPPLDSIGTHDFEQVFSHESGHTYRFERDGQQGCVCERIERRGCVVHELQANENAMVVSFFSPDIETLREIIDCLRANADSVKLRRLIESGGDVGDTHPVVLDRENLTDRQQEVLERAYDMGYFEHPREVSAGQVADALGITTSTFTEHLAASQRKLLDNIFFG